MPQNSLSLENKFLVAGSCEGWYFEPTKFIFGWTKSLLQGLGGGEKIKPSIISSPISLRGGRSYSSGRGNCGECGDNVN